MKEIIINVMPAIVLTFLLQLILHELGHMIGGLFTGWKLIYLQIFHLVFGKGKKGYRLKIVSTCAFQCIMYPKSIYSNTGFYTIGGCLMNLFSAIMGFLGMVIINTGPVIWIYSWCFFIFGLTFFLINAIPNTKRICNDGACYLLLKSDKSSRICHNSQLIIAKYLYCGETYKQIDSNLLCLAPEKADNDITAYQAVLEYYYWLDTENEIMMKNALSKVDINNNRISKNVLDIICMEMLYLDIYLQIRENTSITINNSLYEGNIHEYIKSHETCGDVHTERVKAIYHVFEVLLKDDKDKAINLLHAATSNIKEIKCVYQGENNFCVGHLKKLKNILNTSLYIYSTSA